MQTDPIGYEADINLYAYVGNDPMNIFDPSGMAPVHVMDRRNQNGTAACRQIPACGEFNRGIHSAQLAYSNLATHASNLASTNTSTRNRAKAINNALHVSLSVGLDSPIESLQFIAANKTQNPAFTAGQVAGSALYGAPLAILTRGGSLVGLGNFTATQLGGAIGAIDNAFSKIEGAGFNPSLLSNDQISSIAQAGANNIDVNFNGKSGTLSLIANISGSRIRRNIDVCTFGESRKCE